MLSGRSFGGNGGQAVIRQPAANTLRSALCMRGRGRPFVYHISKQVAMRRHLNLSHAAGMSTDGASGATDSSAEERVYRKDIKGTGSFRFWHEERRFKPCGSACVVQDALIAQGGVRTGGHPRASPIPGPLGYQRPGDWDVLWAPARLALRAAPSLKPGQLIASYPGLMSVTRKRKLPETLFAALGDRAWSVVPHSFTLPDQLPALQEHMLSRAAAGAPEELWILKTAQHLGKGLQLAPATQLCAEASKTLKSPAPGQPPPKPFVLAQQYIANPLLINDRKFGIRVWVLVTGHDPLRVYIHVNGLILFATDGYDSDAWQGESGAVGLGHVTNYAQNVDGSVWDLHQFKAHVGDEAFTQLWARISQSAALVCASALGPMRDAHTMLRSPPESSFEVLGLDYLVDTGLQPWLLEVNGTPSLAVDHTVPEVEKVILTQKGDMVKDMFHLLDMRNRFRPRYEAMRLAARHLAQVKAAQVAEAGKKARRATDDESQDEAGGSDDPMEDGVGAGAAQTPAPDLSVGSAAVLPRRLREALSPKTDAAVLARVHGEMMRLGGWKPLMHLFPITLPRPVGAASLQGAESIASAVGSVQANNMVGSSPSYGGNEASGGVVTTGSASPGPSTEVNHHVLDGVMDGTPAINIPWSARDRELQALMKARGVDVGQ